MFIRGYFMNLIVIIICLLLILTFQCKFSYNQHSSYQILKILYSPFISISQFTNINSYTLRLLTFVFAYIHPRNSPPKFTPLIHIFSTTQDFLSPIIFPPFSQFSVSFNVYLIQNNQHTNKPEFKIGMKPSLHTPQSKSSPMFNQITDAEHIFTPNEYKFASDNTNMQVVFSKDSQCQQVKTYLNIKCKLGAEELNLITIKITHKNLVGLRKIGKSKKPGQQHLYWLYYEPVQFSLENYLMGSNDLNFQNLEQQLLKILLEIKNLMGEHSAYAPIGWKNIGVNAFDIIKVYIPARELITSLMNKSLKSKRDNELQVEKNIREIITKFKEIAGKKEKRGYHTPQQSKMEKNKKQDGSNGMKQRKTDPSRNEAKNAQANINTPNKLSNLSISRFEKIRNDLERIRLKIKSDDRNQNASNANIKSSFYQQNATSMGNSPQNKINKFNLKSQSQHNSKIETNQQSKTPAKSFLRRTNTLNPSQSNENSAVIPKLEMNFLKMDEKGSMLYNSQVDNDPLDEINAKTYEKQLEKNNRQKDQKIHQQNINCINIYHHTNQIMDSNNNNNKVKPFQQRINHLNNNFRNINYNHRQYDEQSCDTYQMELGEDLQMPNLSNNQKLRQTALVPKDRWDTYTVRNNGTTKNTTQLNASQEKNKIVNTMKKKVHESAGQNFFHKFHEVNKQELQKDDDQSEIDDTASYFPGRQRVNEKESCLFESRTINDHRMFKDKKKTIPTNQNQWQSSTIKSAFPTTIQDRVQQALLKTRNVMTILKNPKSNSLGK